MRPERGGVRDLLRYTVRGDVQSFERFLETNCDDEEGRVGGVVADDHRWVILVSIIVRKIIGSLAKPMEWTGWVVDFLLNLLSQNGNLFGLLYNFIRGNLVFYNGFVCCLPLSYPLSSP